MNGTSKDSNSYREQVAGVNLQSQILKILQELLSESLQELWASMKSRGTPLYVKSK